MNLKQFEDKYGTGNKVMISVRLMGNSNIGKEVNIPGEEFQASFGDLVKDYIDHLSMGRIKRIFGRLTDVEWGIVEKKFRESLNTMKVQWQDTTLSR